MSHDSKKINESLLRQSTTNHSPQQLESFVLFTLNSTENKDRFLLNLEIYPFIDIFNNQRNTHRL